ncbi:MAG: hypothetical protein ABI741_11990 [Ferruginibacter sp.]
MIKKIFFSIVILSVFTSCNSKSAFNYSQDIVKKEQSLMPAINDTETRIAGFLGKEQYDSIAAAGARMEKLVDEKLNEIKNQPAPDVKEAAGFKDATLKYFNFIKSLYTGYNEFGSAASAEARDRAMSKLKSIVNQKTDAVNDMQRAQKKFAEANGFKLEYK